jgi:hypothetical protein
LSPGVYVNVGLIADLETGAVPEVGNKKIKELVFINSLIIV